MNPIDVGRGRPRAAALGLDPDRAGIALHAETRVVARHRSGQSCLNDGQRLARDTNRPRAARHSRVGRDGERHRC